MARFEIFTSEEYPQRRTIHGCFSVALVGLLVFFAVWNLSKVPFYWEKEPYTNVTYNATQCAADPIPPCAGLMAQFNLFGILGVESKYKLQCDKDLFLIPHTAMGVSLEALLIFPILTGRRGLYARSKLFFPLSAIFALHILPAAKGIPDSLSGAPVNEVLSVLILLACCVGWVGMRKDYVENHEEEPIDRRPNSIIVGAWVAIGCLVNLLPLGEWILILIGGSPAELSAPHPESGHDFYAKLQCPWIGRIACVFCLYTIFMYTFDEYAKYRGEAWRSPFSKDGPALYQIATMPYPETDGGVFQQVPERWLQATGECFVLTIFVSWMVSAVFNPGIFRDNILRTVIGYNNLCVGFDSIPARYVAMPGLTLQAVLAARYAYLDTIRLKATREILTDLQYYVAYSVNQIFAVWMMCFPLLLVITPEFSSWASTEVHLHLFMATLLIMWAWIAGNILEAAELRTGTKIWFGLFTLHTLALPVIGVLDVLNFHPDLPEDQIYTVRYERPHPFVPWPICAYFDYGWFVLLLLAVIFLPDSPPVETTMRCELPEVYGRASQESEEDCKCRL